jgi:hypothetical protein
LFFLRKTCLFCNFMAKDFDVTKIENKKI